MPDCCETFKTYYVHKNSGGAWFVKEGEFFKSQGGIVEEWGKNWSPIRATSVAHARLIAQTGSCPWIKFT